MAFGQFLAIKKKKKSSNHLFYAFMELMEKNHHNQL